MKGMITKQMQRFLTPAKRLEEALDQPLYHIQTYPQAGQKKLTFFNKSVGDVGLESSNMDSNSELSKGKRQGVFEISVGFFAGADAVEQGIAEGNLQKLINDAKNVLEGQCFLEFKILEKIYLTETPLTRIPAGQGLFAATGGISDSDEADVNLVNYACNGLPLVMNKRKLRVPIPIPAQTKFNVTLSWPSAVTVSADSRIGIWLDGLQIRAVQ